MEVICKVSDCQNPIKARGYCWNHWLKSGERKPYRKRPAVDRFWPKVAKGDGPDACWEWTGAKTRGGYGNFSIDSYHVMAYRFAYELANGPIPDGLTIDHLCRNHGCVRPSHLEAVTAAENKRRGMGGPAVNARKTECHRGHPFEGGRRYCLVCKRANDKRRRRA